MFTVDFRVDDPRSDKHGETVSVEATRVGRNHANPDKLVIYHEGERITSIKESELRAVEGTGGSGGLGLGGL